MEFEGVVEDEIGCFDGGKAWICRDRTTYGLVTDDGKCIEALWCKEDDIAWTYKTDIPHETFMIYEDDEAYCRGIIFSINDLN